MLACARQRIGGGCKAERERAGDEVLMGRYQAAAEVSYAEPERERERERGEKRCVCCETRGRNRSAVLLADSLFFRLSGTVSFLIRTPTHTHKHTH